MPDTDAGLCPACQRKILAPQHRRCMYCGLRLPTNLVLSEAESANVIREKHEKWKTEHEALEARKPKDKNDKRKKRELDEGESAFLLNVMAEHQASKRKQALDADGGEES